MGRNAHATKSKLLERKTAQMHIAMLQGSIGDGSVLVIQEHLPDQCEALVGVKLTYRE